MAMSDTAVVLASRTEVVYGVELPWEERERYDRPAYPDTCPQHHPEVHTHPGGRCTCAPVVKGALINRGTVFVSLSTLYEVCERTTDDYLRGSLPPSIGFREGLALEQAGLARRETRGGYHGTEAGNRVLDELHQQIPASESA